MDSRRKSTRASSRTTSIDSKKSKNEKEKDQAAATIDSEVESVSSGSSMTECKVILDRISSASFNTRSRRKSNLTLDNVAELDSPAKGKRSKVSESVASDDTSLSRTRVSSRLSATQNTPKKEAKTTTTRAGAATPTRRNSRLVESIDLTSSPAVIPAKRALRSNSVASEDLPPASPSTRRSTRSSRLADSQGTPNKAKVESESVMTPGRKGRVSRLLTRQVQEIKEEEEEIETVSIIELNDDTSQSSPKPKSKKRSTSTPETQPSNGKKHASSKKMVTETVDTMESTGKVLLVQTSTANLNPLDESRENVVQSANLEPVKEEKESNDNITETVAPSHDLNAVVNISVVGKNLTPIASLQSDQALPNEKSSVENKMAENVKNDAIIVDESTLDHQEVDPINVNSSDSGEPEIPRPHLETSMESVLVIDESADDTPIKGSKIIESSSASKKKTPLTKSPQADLGLMFQSTTNESLLSSKLDLKPNQTKESSVSGTDQSMQVKNSQTPKKDSTKPKTPSKNDLSLMNVTELINSPKPDASVIELPSNQSKSPKGKTPSKYISEFADMDVTNINSPSTSIIGKAAVNEALTPKQKSQTTESANILDSMNVTELVNSPKPKKDIQETVAIEKQSPKPKTPEKKSQIADSVNALDLMNVTELVNSPKPKTPEQKVQTAEPTNTLDLMNVTELVNSPKPKQRNEVAVIEKQSLKPKTPSKSATESGDNAIEIETPKKVSSKQNSPKSTPVSDKIATPKNKTTKAKTPWKDLNEFGDMNVTKLVEEITVKTATPKKAEENVSAPVADTVAQNIESDMMEGANNQIVKSPSSTKKTTTPKKSPLTSALADQSINLNLEISKIYESLQSPNEMMEPKKPDIFAIPVDDGNILDDTVEPMDVDQTQIGNITSTSIGEQPDNQLDADDNNVSSVSVSSRKSVQIMTPKVTKNTSGLNRLGTPYPDKKAFDSALAREEEIKNSTARFMGYVADFQQKLKPLSQSWNQSLQSVSTEKTGTSGIDTLDNKKDQVDEQPAKVAVPVRNNWAITKGLIDSDSEPEPEPDNIQKIENEGEQSEEESEHSGLLDDKAEAVDDYESGDSENEEDRQYREENEVKHKGIDLGSDDTDGSQIEEDDGDSMDSFIVEDSDEETQDSGPDDSVRNEPVGHRRRFSRIEFEDTSSDEDEQIVSVPMGVVHQEVVIFGQYAQNGEENAIFEGKKFETTMFKNSDEEESVPKKQEKSDDTAQVSQDANESMAKSTDTTKYLQSGSNIEQKPEKAKVVEIQNENIQQAESNEPTTSKMSTEISAEAAQPATVQAEIANTTEVPVVQNEDKDEPCDSKSDQNETVHESNESDISTTSSKENETVQINIPKKMNRISLPGIEALPDSARKMAKENHRKSLGNLVPNQQVLTVSPARVFHGEPSLLKKPTPKASKQAKPKEPVSIKTTIEKDDIEGNTSAKLIDSKVASSQEENNNRKPVKGSKAKRLAKRSETLSTTQSFEEQDNVADEAVPCSSTSTMSVDSGEFKKSMKQKRKFVEIESEAEPSTPPRNPVKYLNIIKTRSGKFIEEPITPEKKDRLGFKVTPMTPVNKAFRVEKLDTNGTNEQVNKNKKRKIVQVDEPAIVLPKPHWTVEQESVQPQKRARNIMAGNTEMIVKPLNEKKRIKSARNLIPVELLRFRESNLYRTGIQRQDSRSLLMDRVKRLASQK